jgi:hypothetical protein
MAIRIRDWSLHFERDRTKQWKILQWVPIPNKQGAGYRKMLSQKNGLEIFACWIALVQVASKSNPRGDLSKYDLEDLSLLTLIDSKKLSVAITYLSQSLDWIEVIENLDTNVNNLDTHGMSNSFDSSILFNSIQSSSLNGVGVQGKGKKVRGEWDKDFWAYRKMVILAYREIVGNPEIIKQQEKLNPGIDIELSLQKSIINFWGTRAGWKNKKGKRSKEINMKATLINNIDKNKVWKDKDDKPKMTNFLSRQR